MFNTIYSWVIIRPLLRESFTHRHFQTISFYISGFIKCQMKILPLSTGTWPYYQHPSAISALYSIWHLSCQSKLLFGIYIAYLYYSHRDYYKWLSYMKVCFIKKTFTCTYYKAIDSNSRAYKYPNIFLRVWAYLLFSC